MTMTVVFLDVTELYINQVCVHRSPSSMNRAGPVWVSATFLSCSPSRHVCALWSSLQSHASGFAQRSFAIPLVSPHWWLPGPPRPWQTLTWDAGQIVLDLDPSGPRTHDHLCVSAEESTATITWLRFRRGHWRGDTSHSEWRSWTNIRWSPWSWPGNFPPLGFKSRIRRVKFTQTPGWDMPDLLSPTVTSSVHGDRSESEQLPYRYSELHVHLEVY